MEKGKVLLIILLVIVGLTGCMFLMIKLMSGGKNQNQQEQLDLEKPFFVYHSLRNSIFPLLAFIDFYVLLMGVLIIVIGSDVRPVGIGVVTVALPLLIFLILKVRWAKDNTEKVLLKLDQSGIWVPQKGSFTWRDIMEVELAKPVRSSEYVQLVVRDEKAKHGYKRIPLATNFSRYSPLYIQSVIEQYKNRYDKVTDA